MIQKYRKKPVVIEAFQLTPELALDALENGRAVEFGLSVSGQWNKISRTLHDAYIIIDTLEGRMKASLGDYIIKGMKGELYPCKADIFEATYEPEARNS